MNEAAPRDAAVARYLEHVTVARRLAPRSVAMISDGLARLEARCAADGVALQAVQPHHVRGWLARLHQGGLAPRSVDIILSSWRLVHRKGLG